MSIGGQWIVTQNKFWIKRKWLNMANIVNFTDKQFENRLNDNLEELVQVKSGWIANRFLLGGQSGSGKTSLRRRWLSRQEQSDKFKLWGKIQMNQGRIIVITGSPGTGKQQLRQLSQRNQIWINQCICTPMTFSLLKQRRNTTTFARIQQAKSGCHWSLFRSCKAICSWRIWCNCRWDCRAMVLEPWKALAQEDYEVHYIVLRASKKKLWSELWNAQN